MKAKTRLFGEIEIADDKIIHFENGIVGFPDLTDFALIHDAERTNGIIRWLQSFQEPNFAMPVMDPLLVKKDYNPQVEEELLKSIGKLDDEEIFVLVTVTVPENIKDISVNLRAPIVIHASNCKAAQIIIDDDKYQVKFPVYEQLQSMKKAGE
ncbi:MAG: flagellar assembly protein FliW [Lachnospiraceae bacterium]|nr:flagellar assembly protein FliW [Lachnospiraceae bacterium]